MRPFPDLVDSAFPPAEPLSCLQNVFAAFCSADEKSAPRRNRLAEGLSADKKRQQKKLSPTYGRFCGGGIGRVVECEYDESFPISLFTPRSRLFETILLIRSGREIYRHRLRGIRCKLRTSDICISVLSILTDSRIQMPLRLLVQKFSVSSILHLQT